jgi:hypothetical protein
MSASKTGAGDDDHDELRIVLIREAEDDLGSKEKPAPGSISTTLI